MKAINKRRGALAAGVIVATIPPKMTTTIAVATMIAAAATHPITRMMGAAIQTRIPQILKLIVLLV